MPKLQYPNKNTSLILNIVMEASPHALRHAFATMLHKNGADIFTIKEFLGHSDVRTTQGYIHVENDDLARKHTQFVNFDY